MTEQDEQTPRGEMLTMAVFVTLLVDVVAFFGALADRRRGWPLPSVLSLALLIFGLWLKNRRPAGVVQDSPGFAELLLIAGCLAGLVALASCFSTQLTP